MAIVMYHKLSVKLLPICCIVTVLHCELFSEPHSLVSLNIQKTFCMCAALSSQFSKKKKGGALEIHDTKGQIICSMRNVTEENNLS